MARLATCPDCKAAVSRERMAHHREKMHQVKPEPTDHPAGKGGNRRKLPIGPARIAILVLILITGAFLAYSYLAPRQYGPHGPVSQECVSHGDSGSFHIHATIRITVNGSKVVVPDGIGLAPCMRPLHTHDDSGQIHIEYRHPSIFTVGEFFDVWGQPFSPTQVLDHKVIAGTTLGMTVNGQPSTQFQGQQLEDGQSIEIVYG